MSKEMREQINRFRDWRQCLTENVVNKRTNSTVWYHGSNSPELTINTIKINDDSPEIFYGNGFYVASDINLAKKYGKYIYEVEFDGNFYEVKSREMLGTYGTFEQYYNYMKKEYQHNILDMIEDEGIDYWSKKLKLSKKELKTLLNNEDNYYLTDRFFEINHNEFWNDYLENQHGLRDEFEEDGYDGLMDITQCVIFNPQKSIKKLELLK